jgi:predicted acyl esterase
MLLRGEPFPARFRNSFETPEPLRPNVATKISFVMPGIVHTFKKGHRIMVQIQSSWFPLVARNPQNFVPNYKLGTDADFQKLPTCITSPRIRPPLADRSTAGAIEEDYDWRGSHPEIPFERRARQVTRK